MSYFLKFSPFLLLAAVAACETMQGAGRDMQHAGQAITHESQEVQSDM